MYSLKGTYRPFAAVAPRWHLRNDPRMVEIFRINDVDADTLEIERRRVTALLQACVPAEQVHEVGSTAVQGVVGKGDLDFLVLVPSQDFKSTRFELDQRFPRNPQQLSNDIFQGYTVESDLDVAIQLTVEGGAHDDFLPFLDRLRASASLREKYNQLKQSFDGQPMNEYRDAKRAFIERALSDSSDG